MTGIASATSAVKIGYAPGHDNHPNWFEQQHHCYRTHRPLVIAERFGTLETPPKRGSLPPRWLILI
jgi:hypothetical protein